MNKQLQEAAELLEEWGAYIDPYFQEKHGLKEDIEKIKQWAKDADVSIGMSREEAKEEAWVAVEKDEAKMLQKKDQK